MTAKSSVFALLLCHALINSRYVSHLSVMNIANCQKPDPKLAGPEDDTTIGSFGVLWPKMLRELREAGCEIDGSDTPSIAPSTPVKKTVGEKLPCK
jgi:hypothetical protein